MSEVPRRTPEDTRLAQERHTFSIEVGESGEQVVEKSLHDIQKIEEKVTDRLGLLPDSPEATDATNQALAAIAEGILEQSDTSPVEKNNVLDDVAIRTAVEIEGGMPVERTPVAILELRGYGTSLDSEVARLAELHPVTPENHEVVPLVTQAIDELNKHPHVGDSEHEVEYISHSIPNSEDSRQKESVSADDVAVRFTMSDEDMRKAGRDWQYDKGGSLQESGSGQVAFANQAYEEVQRQGRVDDQGLAYIMAHEVDRLRDAGASLNARDKASLEHINGLIETRGAIPQLEAARADILRSINSRVEPEQLQTHPDIRARVQTELTGREKERLERQINERIEADKLPWTMPNSHIPQEMLSILETIYEGTIAQESEPSPNDVFRIPPPMKRFEDAQYAPQDEILLAAAGLAGRNGMEFTREELQRAGVFFVNRVGGGEQPIFGVPVPGLEDLPDRTFLTREEFEKVYTYQQEHDYGVGDSDPADVQTDMMVYIAMANGRGSGVRKGSGVGNAREKKYGQTRSPFVDQGYLITESMETYVHAPGKGGQRMNTMTMHLANGHPDYPGVSEMFDEDKVAHDQKYMSTGEFVRTYYQPLPTAEDVLLSMKYGLPTKRELAWAGPQSQEA